MNDPFELPSLEQIEEMDRQRLQAIESLQISDHSVKCQRGGNAVSMIGKSVGAKSNRIAVLERRVRWLENYPHSINTIIIKQLKQELSDILEEEGKADRLRSLPLYSCRITGWKFVCSKSYDKAYNNNMLVKTLKARISK